MSCKSCDLKRIYKLFEEKKRREAESAKATVEAAELARKQEEEKARRESEEFAKRARKKKEAEKEELAVEPVGEEPKEEI